MTAILQGIDDKVTAQIQAVIQFNEQRGTPELISPMGSFMLHTIDIFLGFGSEERKFLLKLMTETDQMMDEAMARAKKEGVLDATAQ